MTAVFHPEASGEAYVWVIGEATKTVRRQAVKTGKLTPFGIQVGEGLAGGEWIAIAGVHYLREGQQVRILEEQQGG